MDELHASTLIDWLQMTYDEEFRVYAVLGLGLEFGERIKPLNGYRFGQKLVPCGRVYWGSGNGRMGCNIVLSGEDCAIMRDRERGLSWAIKQTLLCGRKFTRIDVAVDIKGSHDFTPQHVETMSLEGRVMTRLSPGNTHGRHGETETVEWGNRTGKGNFVRVYDKAVELNLDDYLGNWTRVELQAKHSSKQIGKMLDDGIDIRSIIKRYWDVTGDETWSKLCDLPVAKAVHVPGGEPDTEDWLLKTMPAPWARVLAERVRSGGWESAENFSGELYRRMTIELKRLLNDGDV